MSRPYSSTPTRLDGGPVCEARWLIEPPEGVEPADERAPVELCPYLRRKFLIENGIWFYQLHFFADPDKATQEFIDRESEGMPDPLWRREMDLWWEAFLGMPVYKRLWDSQEHVAKDLVYDPTLSILVGWDFGLDPCVSFGQLDREGCLNILGECRAPEHGYSVREFIPIYQSYVAAEFPVRTRPMLHAGDPSGNTKDAGSGETPFQILREEKIPIIAATNDFEKRRDGVEFFLKTRNRFRISDAKAAFTIQGFNGGYHFPLIPGGGLHPRPEKNEFSHIHDALQYLCWRANKLMGRLENEERDKSRARPNWRMRLGIDKGTKPRAPSYVNNQARRPRRRSR